VALLDRKSAPPNSFYSLMSATRTFNSAMSRPQIASGIDSKDADDLTAYIATQNQENSSSRISDTPFRIIPAVTTTDKYINPYLEVSTNARRGIIAC